MRWLKYNLCTKVNRGTEEKPVWEDSLTPAIMSLNEINERIAKSEAYNGEYTITPDDGQPEPEPTPSEGDSAVWDELDAAYQEGVDSV